MVRVSALTEETPRCVLLCSSPLFAPQSRRGARTSEGEEAGKRHSDDSGASRAGTAQRRGVRRLLGDRPRVFCASRSRTLAGIAKTTAREVLVIPHCGSRRG